MMSKPLTVLRTRRPFDRLCSGIILKNGSHRMTEDGSVENQKAGGESLSKPP